MIRKLTLKNFRRFKSFQLTLRGGNILVGPNNAGKSTVLDAFRILAACLKHTRTRNPRLIEIEERGVFDGYEVPESVLPFSLANINHNYNSRDAELEFIHDNGNAIVILLHPDRTTRTYIKSKSRCFTGKLFRSAFPVDVVVVPTLSPLEQEEHLVLEATVQRNASTRLASRTLRNFWLRRTEEEFQTFVADVEAAWPGITIRQPERTDGFPPVVQMFYGEDRIDREVHWSGFGFQAWLQICTHFARASKNSLLIIDEPDVYLHPDVQRKLLSIVRRRFTQFLMATHSAELINDAETNEIFAVNSKHTTAKNIRSEEDYAAIYRYIGSSNNADFARVARSRKVIFVEGRDGKLLRKFASRFNLEALASTQNIPIVQLGGFTQWDRAAKAV